METALGNRIQTRHPSRWPGSRTRCQARRRHAKQCICQVRNMTHFFTTFAAAANFQRAYFVLFRAILLGIPNSDLRFNRVIVWPPWKSLANKRGGNDTPKKLQGGGETQYGLCNHGGILWSDDHILLRDKSSAAAPNETFIIHAVSFFHSTNHVRSFRSGKAHCFRLPTCICHRTEHCVTCKLVMRKMPETCPVLAHWLSSC